MIAPLNHKSTSIMDHIERYPEDSIMRNEMILPLLKRWNRTPKYVQEVYLRMMDENTDLTIECIAGEL